MRKKVTLLTVILLITGSATFAEEEGSAGDEKRWTLKTGIHHLERQQGRQTGRVYNDGYPGADDLFEDGDVTSFFTSIGYAFNEKWAMDYKYSYDYINNNERYGRGSDKDSGQYINHTARLIRTFEQFALGGYRWDSSIWIGGRNYRESSIEKDGEYQYLGFSSNRFLANANMNTDLSHKTHLDLNYYYQFRDYDYDDGIQRSNQHRHYISTRIDHSFTDSWSLSLDNTLYLRQEVGESRNYGEWDYYYTLEHNYTLAAGYNLNTEFTAWGEVSLWEKGSRQVDDHNQAELIFMPKIQRTYRLADDMNISAYIGAGYVYGYDTRTNRKMYSGFEGRLGAVYSYNF
ncbi:hypothetical protein PM10SUCC1_37550 [Propionigenium maris DSM 9537]|uniref:Uncharacterized protein n=1 Tax=Propionigenium maris DSM 9537 TaxID=1123000 RepID=A0A9W6GQ88_9FUSO|nr:hypothetical protein [Propionigenium maris]GLI58241.1 hypothetical protein PM10SUCC1_37550 [Propionigenium maris DSM 9537]